MSEDKARQGGDLGWKRRQEVVGAFAEAAFALDVRKWPSLGLALSCFGPVPSESIIIQLIWPLCNCYDAVCCDSCDDAHKPPYCAIALRLTLLFDVITYFGNVKVIRQTSCMAMHHGRVSVELIRA